MSKGADGRLAAAGALSRTVLRPEVRSVIEDYERLDSEEARARYADHFLGRTAGVMDEIWPTFYELLSRIKDGELYRQSGYLGGGRTYESFRDYFEDRVGRPFETWAQMESTYHYVQQYAPELFSEPLNSAQATMKKAKELRSRGLALADETALSAKGGDRKSKEAIKNQSDIVTLIRGNSESYLRRRLKRDAPDLYRAVDEGTMSAHSAAVAAGMRHRNVSVRADDPESAARTLRKHMPPDTRRALARLLLED